MPSESYERSLAGKVGTGTRLTKRWLEGQSVGAESDLADEFVRGRLDQGQVGDLQFKVGVTENLAIGDREPEDVSIWRRRRCRTTERRPT